MAESPLPRRSFQSHHSTSSSSSASIASSSTPPPSASTSRHLKRLSLSASSSSLHSPTSSLGSPNGYGRSAIIHGGQHHVTTSPHTPSRIIKLHNGGNGGTHAHPKGVVARPLSSSLEPSESDEESDDPSRERDRGNRGGAVEEEQEDQDLTPQASQSTSTMNPKNHSWDFPSPVSSIHTSAPSSAQSSRISSSNHRSRAGTHPRRGSSISYSSSSALIGFESTKTFGIGSSLLNANGNGGGGQGGVGMSRSNSNGSTSVSGSIGLGLKGFDENSESDFEDSTNCSIASTSPQRSRAPMGMAHQKGSASMSFLSPTRSAMAMTGTTRPTLTEQNADLLSFIAKKERKCLDLREELKRHEAELGQLKAKWEMIIAKSLHSPTAPPAPTFRSSTDQILPRAAHALDLSLLNSTFDSTSITDHHHHPNSSEPLFPSSPSMIGSPEMQESVQAAKAWMGGVFGKVLGAVDETLMTVVGAHPVPPTSHHHDERNPPEMIGLGLGSLKEEDESEGSGSVSTVDRRSSITSSITSEESHPPVPSSPSKTRSRTTLDVLSNGWGSVSKRLSTVTFNETYQSSKKATLGFVDSFEQGIVTALGPLELPPIQENAAGTGVGGYRRPSKKGESATRQQSSSRALKESTNKANRERDPRERDQLHVPEVMEEKVIEPGKIGEMGTPVLQQGEDRIEEEDEGEENFGRGGWRG